MVRASAVSWGFLACIALIGAASAASAQQLPAGGTTSWQIEGSEEIVTFVLFDPKTLRGAPTLPKDGGIGLWFAPVDHSQLAAEIPKDKFDTVIAPSLGSVLGLRFWIPDREYVAYMRARGHHADYGMLTFAKDSTGAYQGEIRLDDLLVRGTALPHGDVRRDPESGTQVLFAPGEKVVHAVVIAGANARHMECKADWSKEGSHALSRGVFVGPTYFTTYETPLKGSAYPLQANDGR